VSLVVATYWWGPDSPKTTGYHPYTADDVRLLQRQVARHLYAPHEFVVITPVDRVSVFDGDEHIRAVPIDWRKHVPGTCFVRLMTFSPEAPKTIGEKVLQIDLDTVIVGSLDSVASRTADLVMWRNPSRIPWDAPAKAGRPHYNTSLLLHRTGTRTDIWESFDPGNPRYRDDQWLLSDKLGPGMPYFDGSGGVYRLAREDTPGSGVSGTLPDNARIVTFPGSEGKPTQEHIAAANPWIAEHRR
jgi:hypothetical protein